MTITSQWTPITAVDNIPPREGRAVFLGDREIAIFHVSDGEVSRYYAIDNRCPHKGGPLCDGMVSGKTVVCPLHGQRFDLESGMPVLASQPDAIGTYPVRVENGVIHLSLTDHATK